MKKCNFCGNEQSLMFSSMFDTRLGMKGKYQIYYCNNCDLGETYPKITENELEDLYTNQIGIRSNSRLKRFYRNFKWSKIGTLLTFYFDRAYVLLNNLPQSNKYHSLLDIGCSVGDWLVLYSHKGYDVFGIDLNYRQIEIAKQRGLKVEKISVEKYISSNQKFDLIILSQVFEHLLDPKQILQQIRQMMSEQSRVVISVPNLNSYWKKKYKAKWIGWYVPFHIFHYSEKALKHILNQNGFEVVKILDYTPPSWLIGSYFSCHLSKYGVKNKHITSWWHSFILPFVSLVSALGDALNGPGGGDCICIIAKKNGY